MADSNKKIPTLTNIVHPGDDSMRHHFDEQSFQDTQDGNFVATTVENATDIENRVFTDIPSIKADKHTTATINTKDFSDTMPLSATKSTAGKSEKNVLKAQIDQAITEALSGVETALKKKLYKKFGV